MAAEDAMPGETLEQLEGGTWAVPLVPRALDLLEADPLAEGDYYPGDLLMSVVGTVPYAGSSPGLLQRLLGVVDRAVVRLGEDDEDLRRQLARFSGRHRPGESRSS
jgi:hypothetical protein